MTLLHRHPRKLGALLLIGLAALVLALLVGPRALRGEDTSWLAALRSQVKSGQNCDLAFLVTHRELKLGNDVRVEGRLRCADGREFDFTRAQSHQKFDVRLCQPSYC